MIDVYVWGRCALCAIWENRDTDQLSQASSVFVSVAPHQFGAVAIR